MDLAIVGTGHVGLVTGACLAEMGNNVICVDNDLEKVESLQRGRIPIYEPKLEELVLANQKAGRIEFIDSIAQAVDKAEVIFITVGTPANSDGSADLTYVEAVSREIAQSMSGYLLVVEKSTVPVNTCSWIKQILGTYNKNGSEFDVASVPEFLREGSAVEDFLRPSRIVIGTENPKAEKILQDLFAPLNAPVIGVDIKSAELIKHASNSFLALKISYINAVANICERVGADVVKVAKAMGLDPRIGPAFLQAGVGYGGSCFPKDLAAFANLGSQIGYEFGLLHEVARINQQQTSLVVDKLKESLGVLSGKRIGVLGLAFKPQTDDIREAPALSIIAGLLAEGVVVKCYDPVAMPGARGVFGEQITYCLDPYDLAEGCDALVLVTEWPQFGELDFKKIKGLVSRPVLVDGRNFLDPDQMGALGFEYRGIGR